MWETDEPGAQDAARRLRVVIVDDASAMRALLRRMLEDSAAFDILAEAGDGEEAVRLADTLHPDVVLLDLAMPVMDGLAAIPRIRSISPASRIVVLSAIEATRMRDQALASGADAFIDKRLLTDSLAQRLVDVCRHTDRSPSAAQRTTIIVTEEPAGERFDELGGPAFDHAPIGMAVVDAEGRMHRVNDAFCRMIGRPPAELLDSGLHTVSHPGDVERHAALRRRLLSPGAHPSYQAEQRFIRADGHVASTIVTCTRLDGYGPSAGSAARFVVQVLDVSERKMAELAGARAEELRERYEKELARSIADLAQFATVAAHDLKSPLQVIAGFAALLEQTQTDTLDERGQEFLGFIVRGADRMNRLIDDLLTFARVGAERRPPAEVVLSRVLDDVRLALRAEIEASGATVDGESLPILTGDPAQFEQLLTNLVANAIAFVAPGTAPRVRVSASRMVHAWCVDVADNGIGIDAAHRSHVFGMFARLHSSDAEGTGIGLAICQRIVEQRGGSIWVEDNPGGGSRLRFTVPDEGGVPPPNPAVLVGGPTRAAERGPVAHRPRVDVAAPGPSGVLDVLLVEDDDDHARLVAETLASGFDGGYRLRRATDLAGAREELLAQPADCVLLDLFLPDGVGLDALRQITVLDPLVPIVILTSLADEQLGLSAVHEGAQDYLVKGTVDGARLSRALRHAIERKALEARFASQALHDPLTGLANRTLLLDRLRLELARTGRTGPGVAVLYLDVDRFKDINDRLGHAAGDEVLTRLARRLVAAVRPGDTVSRVGGDEFVVLCGGLGDEAELEQMRDRIAQAVERPLGLLESTELVTTSIGTAVARGADEDPAAVIRRADEAMYEAKHAGRPADDDRPAEDDRALSAPSDRTLDDEGAGPSTG